MSALFDILIRQAQLRHHTLPRHVISHGRLLDQAEMRQLAGKQATFLD